MECASEPDGIAAGAGALPGARRRCEAGKRTHGPGPRACLALLAATALLALAAPAQAQTEIWSATLTPVDLGDGVIGCLDLIAFAACSSTAILSDDDFTHDSTDYTVSGLFVEANGNFSFSVDTTITTETAALTLVVGSTSLVLADATTRGTLGRIWASSGVSLTVGTAINVKLTAPAQAQTEIWSATLTPVDLGDGVIGCLDLIAFAACSSTAILSDDDFTHDSTDYTVSGLFVEANGNFSFSVDTTITTETAALTLVVGSTSLVLADATTRGTLGRIWASSGVSLTVGTAINVKLTAAASTNTAPTVANTIPNQTATAGTAFSYAFLANTFADTDPGDTLTYTATQSDDTALPSWLSFAAATRTFSGTPTAADVGTVSVKVTASDGHGGSVSDTFDIVVSAAAGVTVSKSALTVTEEDTTGNTYTVVLDTRPTANVTVTVAGHGGTDVTLTPSILTFTTANWNLAQTVTVKAGNDTDTTNDTVTLTHSAASTDTDYDGISIDGVAVTVNDNDTAPATGAPTITGTAQVGQTLTAATTGITDADGLTSPTYTYQWIRVDGTDEADIAAANSSTYILVDADLGTTLKVRVTFADDLGHTETLTSAASATVGAAATAPTVTDVAVTSTPASGTTYYLAGEVIEFTVTFSAPVTVTSTPKFAFRLGAATRQAAYASGSDSAALVFARTVQAGEVDRNGISWNALALALDGGTITQTGATTAARLTHAAQAPLEGHRVDAAPPMQVSASVQGLALVLVYDEPLDPASMPATGAYTVTATVGATATNPAVSEVSIYGIWVTLTLDAAPAAGATVTLAYAPPASNPVQDEAGNDAPAFSGQKVNGAAGNTAPTGAPTITGTAQVGQTLTASTTGIADADGLTSPTYTYQWIRVNGTEADIAGENSSTYILVDADLGTTLKVRVTFADDLGHTETLTSAATATVVAAATAALGQVLGVGVAPGNAHLVVTWTAVDTATGYTVQWMSGSQGYNTGDRQAPVTSGSTTRYTIPSLTNGTEYTVQVIATRTGATDGPPSEEMTGTPRVPPPPPPPPPPPDLAQVTDVAVTSTPASGTTYYLAGEVIEFTVTFSAPVTVTATPKFAFRLGAATRQAAYARGSDSAALVFARTVQAGEVDRNGISWNAIALALDGGTITQTGATTAARLTHAAQAPLEGHRVDAAPPMQVSASVQGLALVLVYDEPLDPASMPAPGAYTVTATVGATATNLAVSEVSIYGIWVTLTLDAKPAAGATVTLAYAPPASNPVQDEAGNDAPAFSGQSVRLGQPPPPPPDLAQVLGVGVAPGNAHLVVTWTAVDTATGYTVQWMSGSQGYNTGDRQAPVTSGSTTRYTIPSLTNGTAYTVQVIATRTGATDGPPSEEMTGTPRVPPPPPPPPPPDLAQVTDVARQRAWAPPTTWHGGTTYYLAGEVIEFTVTFSAPVTVTATPKFAFRLGAATRQAAYARGSDSAALVFARTVQAGEVDRNGISWNAIALALDGGTITQTGATTAARLTHAAQAPLEGHRVDAAPPMQVSASVQGLALVLVYDEPLDPASMPAPGAYTVTATVGATATNLAVSEVSIYGIWVTLTLDAKPAAGATVTLAYAPPASNPVQDEAGNDAPAFSGQSVRLGQPPPPPPDLAQVLGVGVAPGNAHLVVTWTAVDTATGYTVQWMSGSQGYNPGDRQAPVTSGSTTRYTIPSLTNGTAYTVQVIATRTGVTDGPPSAEMTGTPRVPPPPPPPPVTDLAQVLGVGVLAPGNARLVVTWTAVDTATGYTVQWMSDGEGYTTGDRQAPVTSGSPTRYTIPSLINGTAYTVRVIATRTGVTDGPPSAEVTATPVTTPGAPQDLRGEPGDAQVTLTWAAPASDGGSAILRYEYAVDDSGTWIDAGGDLEETVRDLTSGQSYAVAVRAVTAAGAGPATTVTSVPADPRPQAWLARFGRTATDHVVDAVSSRWHGGPQASHLTLGGPQAEALLGWTGLGGQAARDTTADRGDSVRTERASPRLVAPSGGAWPGVGGTGPGMTVAVTNRTTAPGGLGGVDRDAGAPLRGRAAPRALLDAWGLPDPRALTDLRAALMGSSFVYAGAQDDDGQARTPGWLGAWSAWGRGAASWFSGADGGASLEGEVATAMLGFDSRWGRWRAGVVASHSRGQGTYTPPTAPGGAVASTLTALHPYAGYDVNARTSVWGVVGYGVGEMSLTPARATTARETDLTNTMAAVGGRTALSVRSGRAGRFELALRSDARLTNTAADAVAGLVGATERTRRVRMMLEGAGTLPFALGGVLTPTVEAGLRYDTGDAETGAGLEVGGGLGYAVRRLSVTVNARGLLAHQDTAYEEWGFSGAMTYTPSADGRGLSMRLGSGWGATHSGVESLWSRQDAAALVRHAPVDAAQAYQLEVRYGLDGRQGRARWAPYLGVASGGGSRQALRLGVTLTAGRRLDAGLELGQRQGAPGADPEHAAQLRATLRW